MDILVQLIVIVICTVVAKTEVRFANQSTQPTAPSTYDDISDSAENTCAAFDYSTNGAKFTKIRINITLPAGEGALMISGHNMNCNASPAALYVLPLTAEDSNRWQGIFKRCHLTNDTNTNPKRCFYDCECPAEGCSDVQITHMPITQALKGWTLCHVATITDLTRIPGVTCSASSVYNEKYPCEGAYTGVVDIGNYNDWAGKNEVHGVWIRLDFHQMVIITNIAVWPRCAKNHQFARVEIETSATSKDMITRTCNGNDQWDNCDGIGSESYPIGIRDQSDYVKLTGYDPCAVSTTNNNGGFREIIVKGFKL